MIKVFLKIVFILFSLYSYTQNQSYKIIYEEIYPKLNSDYQSAKEEWLKMEAQYDSIDPAEQVLMSGYALMNNDITFFKRRIIPLMKYYGWNYSQELDTMYSVVERSMLKRMIQEKNLITWVSKKSNKHYSKWKTNAPLYSLYRNKVDQIVFSDQEVIRLFNEDTTLTDNCVFLDSLISTVHFYHIEEIIKLCKLNNGLLLNNFDNGIGIYNKLSFIIWHNLKIEVNFQKTWDALLPFIEKAYFQNKISYTLFMAYDKWSLYHYGNQYYGTINGKDIREEVTFPERKKKYRL
ncbi:hypothetical protein [Crocinitomix algicola]|uniref:hypothetical protein n=1 Tax=Crocinitomix algicola TaxID=1740263 RepID=UPI000833A321|nr:hypothetical protein [Crocinitomix algicola]